MYTDNTNTDNIHRYYRPAADLCIIQYYLCICIIYYLCILSVYMYYLCIALVF